MILIYTANNFLSMTLEGPTQQWMSRHYPVYQSSYVFQKHEHGQPTMLGEFWLKSELNQASSIKPARGRHPLALLPMFLSSDNLYFSPCLETRSPRRCFYPLQSLRTILQYVHLPHHESIGFDRGLRCPDRTDAQLLRDRPHRNTNGPPAVLRPHDRHSAHVLQTYRLACRAVNRSIGFSSSPAFYPISRTSAVLTVYLSPTPLFGPDPPLTSVGTISPAQLGHLAHTFVVKVLHVVPFRHAEHAKPFLRGIRGISEFTPAILHQKTFRLFRALRSASSM